MKMIRVFMAVELPSMVKQELGLVAGQLAEQIPAGGVRWVKPELMHITVRFLGETAVSQLDAITEIINNAAQKQKPLTLNLDGTGCFPNANRPRVIWVGLAGQVPELGVFKRELDTGLAALGWEIEKRPFTPHLTLGRVKDAKKLRGVSWDVAVRALEIPVTAVHLIESELTRQGPIYKTRHTSCFI